MKKNILFLAFIIFNSALFSQTTLVPGDIAILQYNSDGSPETIKFVVLTSMESGTTINFTDNGWFSDNTFRTSEGVDVWTAGSDISCGTIVTFTFTNISLNANGDQVIAYQGTLATPSFVYALNCKNTSGVGVWQTGFNTGSSNKARKSALPLGLTDGSTAVSLKHKDNYKYTGSLTGSKTQVLSNISDDTKWTGHNTTVQNFSGDFNTTWGGTSWDGTSGDFLTATIDGSYDTSTYGNFKSCNCTVNSGKTLTVNPGGTVTVENNITNNGTISVESGGSVVQVMSSGTNTGTSYSVKRATTSQSSRHVFTYWSSPITTETFTAVAADAHLYYSFNAATQGWVLGSSATSMSPGIGYALEGPDSGATYPGAQTATFNGAAFNNGNVSVGLSYSADGDADNDWNLVGNPYPSAISADTFLTDNSTTTGGSIYFWTHNTIEDGTVDNTEDDYAMYTYGTGGTVAVTGGVEPDGNIASGQGFFLQALADSTVRDLYTNKMRIAGSNTSFFKSAKKVKSSIVSRDRIWLNLTNDKSFSQILVGFFDGATDEVDRKYDGTRFIGKTTVNFYSLIGDEKFGIQGLSELKSEKIIPLGFSTTKTGVFRIAIDKREGKLLAAKLLLVDKLLNIEHKLDESYYEFTSVQSGTFDDRFELIVQPEEENIDEEDPEEDNSNKIKVYRKGNFLYVNSLEKGLLIDNVSIYSLKGNLLYNKKAQKRRVRIKVKKLRKRRLYVVKIQLSTGEIIVKKMLFKKR